jgi:hypothetical protein
VNKIAEWLPDLLLFSNHGNDWSRYCKATYDVFFNDFVSTQPSFGNMSVRCRHDPIFDGKEAGFWHCISEGRDEENRTPDFDRCERIGWVRAIIENAADQLVDVWERRNGSDIRIHLWLDEQYLVVIGVRSRSYQLITAFCTTRGHTIRSKQRERDRSKRLTPPF